MQHLRDSLLRDTNRGMDQQRVVNNMKAERRETICVQAQQGNELEKDLCEAEKKVNFTCKTIAGQVCVDYSKPREKSIYTAPDTSKRTL